MAKITVTIDIGRKSYNCTRAGICSITVGLELFLNSNQVVGLLETVDGSNVVKLHFLESLKEQGICGLPIDYPVLVQNADRRLQNTWVIYPGNYQIKEECGHEFIELRSVSIPLV